MALFKTHNYKYRVPIRPKYISDRVVSTCLIRDVAFRFSNFKEENNAKDQK